MSKMRDVKVVTIKGLNSRDTINTVEDGWCEELHNVAFREGKFRTVCDYECIQRLNFGDYKIKYLYAVLPEGDFIAYKDNDIVHLKSSDGVVRSVTIIKSLPPSVDMESVKISHFEATLFISYIINEVEYQDAFIYSNEKFTLSNVDTLLEMVNVDFNYDFNQPTKDSVNDYAAKVMSVTTTTDSNGYKHITNVTKQFEQRYAYLKEQDYLHGGIYIFFAYKMKDGSIFRNGRIYMLECEQGKSFEVNTLYKLAVNGDLTHYYKNIIGFKVRISFYNLAPFIANNDIKSIVVYSTRNNPMYNFENLHYDFPTDARYIETMNNGVVRTNAKCVRDRRMMDIASMPFYAVAEVDFRANGNVTLSANSYEDIEQKPIFTPTVSPHTYTAKGSIELNRRCHLYNVRAQLYPSAMPFATTEELYIDGYKFKRWLHDNKSDIMETGVAVTLNVNGENIVVNSFLPAHIYMKRKGSNDIGDVYYDEPYLILPNIMSYPDVRATKMDVIMTRKREGIVETLLIKSFILQPAAANNYACYREMSRDIVMFYELFTVRSQSIFYDIVVNKNSYSATNQVMVSEVGRPYLFQPQHVYYVGSSDSTKIEDVNTPIDQLTESRFGQYPLYLFTTSGIYAMEQGAERVYDNIVKVNTDIIKNATNSLSAYGALYYFSSSGLMRLNGHTSSMVSDVINNDIFAFMNGAKLMLIPQSGELIAINGKYDIAYLYSLRSGSWSSRDFRGEMMSYDTYLRDNALYNLLSEDNSKPLHGMITTRELLLGSRQIKRIDRFKADITSSSVYEITIMGSLDAVVWCKIASSDSCDMVRRVSSSWKYYKIKIEGADFLLDNLLFESFTRFVSHIR